RVDAARERLDEHGRLIGQRIRHPVDLARMCDERLTPAPAGIGAVTGLETDLDRTLRDVVAEAGPPLRAARTWRIDATDETSGRRLDHDPCAVVEHAHALVAGDERIA